MAKKYRYEVEAPVFDKQGNLLGIGVTTEELTEDNVNSYKKEGVIYSAKKINEVM